MTQYIAAIDQGTTGTRCIVFDSTGRAVAMHYEEHHQIYPQPGWVEHDPLEIWQKTQSTVRGALDKGNIHSRELLALGVANQRVNNTLVGCLYSAPDWWWRPTLPAPRSGGY